MVSKKEHCQPRPGRKGADHTNPNTPGTSGGDATKRH